jgi:hypothetical protein
MQPETTTLLIIWAPPIKQHKHSAIKFKFPINFDQKTVHEGHQALGRIFENS